MRLTPAVVELVVADMPATVAFSRRLRLDLPDDDAGEGHVETMVEGLRLAFDAPWGMRYAVVLDPDGTPVDLFAGSV